MELLDDLDGPEVLDVGDLLEVVHLTTVEAFNDLLTLQLLDGMNL